MTNEYLKQRQDQKLGLKPIAEKKVYSIPKKSAKKLAQEKEEKKALEDGLTPKEKWFQERRKEMTGVCLFCGGKTERDNDQLFRHSVAHLMAKKKGIGGFPSVALHRDNWIELCYHGNSCHTNFDNGVVTWEFLRDSAEWEIIVAKFKSVYPHIATNERSAIPELLLKEVQS